MGIKKKHVPGCSCCGAVVVVECGVYDAPDGTEFADDFSSLSGGWTFTSDASLSVSGGHGFLSWDTGFGGTIFRMYRSFTVTSMTGFYAILEVQIYQPAECTFSALYWVHWESAGTSPATSHSITADWDNTRYTVRANGDVTHFEDVNPTDGDKLTIHLFAIDGGILACYYVNENLLLGVELTGADFTTAACQYGMMNKSSTDPFSLPAVVGEYDNFSIEAGP